MTRKIGVITFVLSAAMLLGGCSTSSRDQARLKLEEPIVPVTFEYSATSRSRLPTASMIGRRYVFHYAPELGDEALSLDDLEPVLVEIERRLAPQGFTRVDDYDADDADFALIIFAGFTVDVSFSSNPIFVGGERRRIEHEYQVPRFDRNGRFIGMRTQRDYEYYTTPRVQTGTQHLEHRRPHATITFSIDATGARPDVTELAGDASADWRFGESVLYLGIASAEDEDPHFERTGSCLAAR